MINRQDDVVFIRISLRLHLCFDSRPALFRRSASQDVPRSSSFKDGPVIQRFIVDPLGGPPTQY